MPANYLAKKEANVLSEIIDCYVEVGLLLHYGCKRRVFDAHVIPRLFLDPLILFYVSK